MSIADTMNALGSSARAAATALALAGTATKNKALAAAAASIRQQSDRILAANAKDVGAARESGLSSAMLDRLSLDPRRIEGMARGVEEVAALADPVNTVIAVDLASGRLRQIDDLAGIFGI